MKFKTGDKVKFLHDTGKGVVSSVINKTQVMVQTEDGFDVPYMISDLVKYDDQEDHRLSGEPEETDNPSQRFSTPGNDNSFSNSEASEVAAVPETENTPVADDEVVFAVKRRGGELGLSSYLINCSSYMLYYTVSKNIEGEENLLAKGSLEPDIKVQLANLVPARIDEVWKIRINLLFWNHGFYKAINPVVKTIELDFREITSGNLLIENDFFDENALVLPVFSFREKKKEKFENKASDLKELAEILEKEKRQVKQDPSAVKSRKKQDIEEVDLHIESITDDHKGLSNGEILEIQMSRFKTSLDTAIIHKARRIVFIHGVGNGKLRQELRKTLDRKYPRVKYQDASFKEYGYGATMVIIHK